MSQKRGSRSLVELAVGSCLTLAATQTFAQSTGTQIEDKQLEEVIISGGHKIEGVDGLIQP